MLLEVKEICGFADYFVLCSAESSRQVGVIADDIERSLKKEGVSPHHHEGTPESGWVLLDFGDVIVHVFSPSQREYYQLDRLWAEAKSLVRIQ